ncbi:MAG: hypothetical protein M1826_006464 [Phylliscum demangeonii]|nr:MAG: hypothetical protein M1826_006464 [Phylliscum demangeonii]
MKTYSRKTKRPHWSAAVQLAGINSSINSGINSSNKRRRLGGLDNITTDPLSTSATSATTTRTHDGSTPPPPPPPPHPRADDGDESESESESEGEGEGKEAWVTPPSSPPAVELPGAGEGSSAAAGMATATDTDLDRISLHPTATAKPGTCTSTCPPAPAPTTRPPRPRPPPRQPLQQLQIDLGGSRHRRCAECGMDYIPSHAEDSALHRAFHAQTGQGIEVGRVFEARPAPAHAHAHAHDRPRLRHHAEPAERIVMVHRRSRAAERARARRILDVVDAELSAAAIPDQSLWQAIQVSVPADAVAGRPYEADRFRVFLYLQGTRCVGLCLAEHIHEAHRVLPPLVVAPSSSRVALSDSSSSSSSIEVSGAPSQAMMGVARIWTSRAHRRQGLATRLLQAATHAFVYGFTIPKHQVAFSQPTESGKRFAETWFEGRPDWQVYVEKV